MISRLEISAQHMEMTPKLHKYATQKIGRLDRFVPRNSRQSVHAQVILKESKAKDKKQCTCNIILHLPHEVMDAHETTINMFAAIDIAETKLKNQLKKYKDLHAGGALHRRVWSRLSRRA
jgi:ribosomal subunit interface protein